MNEMLTLKVEAKLPLKIRVNEVSYLLTTSRISSTTVVHPPVLLLSYVSVCNVNRV